jgi:hypothetical protein
VKRLAGLVKYALKAGQGRVQLPVLAAASAQRQATVRKGLDWLAAKGYLSILDERGDELRLAQSGQPDPEIDRLAAQLRGLLEETQAYRAYFVSTEKENLVER